MDADDYKVEAVLKEDRRFIVPLYQRKYQWAEHRLLPFWEDVQAKAAEVLSGESRFEHYMGALIIAPVDIGSQISKTPVVQVVDGQQRLTTFQIFLAALREVARRNKIEDFINHVNGYIFNNKKSKDLDPLTKYKLTPTPSDREIFHDLMDMNYVDVIKKYKNLFYGTRVPKNTKYPAFRAYIFFFKWIEDFIVNGPNENVTLEDDGENSDPVNVVTDDDAVSNRIESLMNAVLERLKLVVISLGESDDAQVIFETLNSKGEPLLAMDLVRNNIFHRAEKQGAQVEELYRKLWDPLDGVWWREAAPNARPTRPRIDHFLAHVLVAETGGKISMRELYAEYRAFAVPRGKPRFEDVEDELRLIDHYAPIYETLEGRKSTDTALAWFGRKMSAWQTTTIYPVAMQLGSDKFDESVRKYITKLLYSYIVRRALCGLTTKNLNNVFQGLASKFHQDGASVETLKSYFDNRDGDSVRFPDDRELKVGIMSADAYSIAPQSRLVDILWELEEASRSSFAEKNERPTCLWVEHVLPKKWTDQWLFSDGSFAAPDSGTPEAGSRRAVVETLGNLTLVTPGLNISVSNRSFEEKKKKFFEHTGLFLNKWFSGRSQWTEAEIKERGEHLAGLAIKIWPHLNMS
ncbi:MAG: DUF262 domain-containing protein [Zavarzinia sp.]|nr:DUF262 domain-containing protein [Zavarzinia sp.]